MITYYEKHKDLKCKGIGRSIVGQGTLLIVSSFHLNAPVSVQTARKTDSDRIRCGQQLKKFSNFPQRQHSRLGTSPLMTKKTINEEFCKFFSSTALKLKEKALPLTNFAWKVGKLHVNKDPRFRYQTVTEQDILKQLRRLKRKCATGVDNI